jgi:hypothetical protein
LYQCNFNQQLQFNLNCNLQISIPIMLWIFEITIFLVFMEEWSNVLSHSFSIITTDLKQQSADRHVHLTQTHYPDSRANMFLLFLLNSACLAEKQQISMWFNLRRAWHDPIYIIYQWWKSVVIIENEWLKTIDHSYMKTKNFVINFVLAMI